MLQSHVNYITLIKNSNGILMAHNWVSITWSKVNYTIDSVSLATWQLPSSMQHIYNYSTDIYIIGLFVQESQPATARIASRKWLESQVVPKLITPIITWHCCIAFLLPKIIKLISLTFSQTGTAHCTLLNAFLNLEGYGKSTSLNCPTCIPWSYYIHVWV